MAPGDPGFAAPFASAVSPQLLSIAFGAADVALIYTTAFRLFGRVSVAVLSALLLLLTPAYAMFSRTAAGEGRWAILLVLIWAATLGSFAERRTPSSRWWLAAGTAALMLVAVVEPTQVILVAVLGVVTIATAQLAGRLSPRELGPAGLTAAAFAFPVAWRLRAAGPDGVSFARWIILRADIRSPQIAAQALSRFWEFFQPSHLFLNPEGPAFAGLFLAGMCVPVAFGAYALFGRTGQQTAGRLIVAAGCVAGPLTAALCGPPTVDARAITILPFGVLLAGYGWVTGWRSGLGRGALLASACAMLAQVWWLWNR